MNRAILIAAGIFLFSTLSQAQQKEKLEQKRKSLLSQIDITRELLKETDAKRKVSLEELQAVETQIKLTRELRQTIASEIAATNHLLSAKSAQFSALEAKQQTMQQSYAGYLKSSYRQQLMQHPLLFLLSAHDLNQAFQRWRYLKQLSGFQKTQHQNLVSQQDSLNRIIAIIEQGRKEKDALLKESQKQEQRLSTAMQTQKQMVSALQKEEAALRSKLKQQEEESKRLKTEIERLIRAEMESSGTTAGIPETPAMKALSSSFKSNRGKLPWPVERGVITGRFGTQPHAVLKSIKVKNNGIDISTTAGADVLAVFDGTVVGSAFIPGFDQMVMVRHGSFYSVYSRLQKVFVKKGETVGVRQALGSLTKDGEATTVHFEIWDGKQQVDPETWLAQ